MGDADTSHPSDFLPQATAVLCCVCLCAWRWKNPTKMVEATNQLDREQQKVASGKTEINMKWRRWIKLEKKKHNQKHFLSKRKRISWETTARGKSGENISFFATKASSEFHWNWILINRMCTTIHRYPRSYTFCIAILVLFRAIRSIYGAEHVPLGQRDVAENPRSETTSLPMQTLIKKSFSKASGYNFKPQLKTSVSHHRKWQGNVATGRPEGMGKWKRGRA